MIFGRRDRTRAEATDRHDVLDAPLIEIPPTGFEGGWPTSTEVLYVAMGCFWGAERIFWQLPGVVSTAVGYMGGDVTDPSYAAVCDGDTGHTETVMVAYDPTRTTPEALFKAFWENHDPTTLNRQGNDTGTQYRSAIFWTTPAQEAAARSTAALFQRALDDAGRGRITTQMTPADEAGPFWLAERYHQQYLSKNPGGYCNHGYKGVTCPVGVANLPAQTDVLPPSH